MKGWKVLIPIVVSLVASTGTASDSEIRNGRTSVNLSTQGRSLFTRVTLNGDVRGKFVVDTGASVTMISPRIARKLGIEDDEGSSATFTMANGKTATGRIVYIEEMSVGRATVWSNRVAILDKFRKTGFDGLLGMSFLEHFVFKIDYEESRLILYER